MNLSEALLKRSQAACELCEYKSENLSPFIVPPRTDDNDNNVVVLCDNCLRIALANEFSNPDSLCFLTTGIWSEVPAVKVLSHKLLSKLTESNWAQEALEGAYLDEAELLWANAEEEALESAIVHKDAYGAVLQNGDTVFLTESLNVKGANFMAQKGTKVAKIRLVPDNEEQIEGKIEGSVIVILTKFVRKGS